MIEYISKVVGRIYDTVSDLEHYQPKGQERPSEGFIATCYDLRNKVNELIRRLPKNQ